MPLEGLSTTGWSGLREPDGPPKLGFQPMEALRTHAKLCEHDFI
jgi:hypothetical protein